MTTKDIDKDIDYDFLVDNALRGVVKIVLQSLERKENIGEHHFFITFLTQSESVNIPNHFLSNHPNTMTIVLQHQFWELKVNNKVKNYNHIILGIHSDQVNTILKDFNHSLKSSEKE